MHVTSWSRDLSVGIGGHDVINHAGAAALRLLADRTGLATLRDQAELFGLVASDPTLWRVRSTRSASRNDTGSAGRVPRPASMCGR